jgi:hypothetical protein
VPIFGVHSDGVQYTSTNRAGGAKSLLVASWNVISASSPKVRNLRQPLFVIRKARLCKCGCSGAHTLDVLYTVLAWSMRCLLAGIAPGSRHDGSPFTPRDRKCRLPVGLAIPPVALLQVRGDWEGMATQYMFRWFTSDRFCWLCDATKDTVGDRHYADFRPEAPHRQTLITHQAYFGACAAEGTQPSSIFKCPGLQLDYFAIDSMHAGDLGTFQDAIGSIFWLEITNKQWYRN